MSCRKLVCLMRCQYWLQLVHVLGHLVSFVWAIAIGWNRVWLSNGCKGRIRNCFLVTLSRNFLESSHTQALMLSGFRHELVGWGTDLECILHYINNEECSKVRRPISVYGHPPVLRAESSAETGKRMSVCCALNDR